MAHFFVHLILPKSLAPGCSIKEVESAVESALGPHWTRDGTNEDGWWDYYEIGGLFNGIVKPLHPLPSPAPTGILGRLFGKNAPSNVALAEDVLATWSEDHAPFVVVTPDGAAHGADDWSKENFTPWSARFKALVEQYRGHLVVGVDCHS